MSDAMTVATLLAQARAAHDRYRQAAGRINGSGKVSHAPQPINAGGHLQDALSLRTEAHSLDPDHHDPAWVSDQHAMQGQPSEALVDFYVRALSR